MITPTAPSITTLDHLVLTVEDIGATVRFYGDVLGMQAVEFQAADGGTRAALCYGSQKINLHAAAAPFAPNAAVPTSGSADLCFLSDTPLTTWQQHFEALDVAVIDGPVRRTGATGPITSLYVRDPDGNLIEVSTCD